MEINPTYEDIISSYGEKVTALIGENVFLLAKVARMIIYIEQIESQISELQSLRDIPEATEGK